MKISNVVNFLIVFTIVIDMGGELGIRKIGFALLAIMFLINFLKNKSALLNLKYALFFSFFIIYPTGSLFFSIIAGVDPAIGLSQISVFYFSFVYFLKRILDRDIELVNGMTHLNYSLIAMASFYILMMVFFITVPTLFFSISDFIHIRGAGFSGLRNEDNIQLANVYLKSSLFLIFTYSFYIKRNFFVSFLVFLGSIITTSKALMLTQLLLLSLRFKIKLSWFIVLSVSLLLLFYVFTTEISIYADYIYDTISGKSESFSARAHHLSDFSNLVGNDFKGFLFGFGPGTKFYSSNSGSYITNIEVDHFNIIRKFGLLWFLGLVAIVFYTLFLLYKVKKIYIAIGLLFSFLLAGTNPVLLSPVFFIILVECYIYTKRLKNYAYY